MKEGISGSYTVNIIRMLSKLIRDKMRVRRQR
jgi:hypothetical protein